MVSVACWVVPESPQHCGGRYAIYSNWEVQIHVSILPQNSSDAFSFLKMLYQSVVALDFSVAGLWGCSRLGVGGKGNLFCGYICIGSILLLLSLYDYLGLVCRGL